jgi:uncharacterized membrane protein YgcG
MVEQWRQDVDAYRDLSVAQIRQFELQDPAQRAQLQHSGSQGTGFSFGGGGGGGGGGGAGGSW